MELFREDEVFQHRPVMAYVSATLPGVVRGPHEHRTQSDYFVFIGPGNFRLYLWDARIHSTTYGHRLRQDVGESNPLAVRIPPGVVHAYENTSNVPGWVFNAPNQLYGGRNRSEPVDEIRYEEDDETAYQLF
jgi:dTDP-4-dehydrorhamnose 3,5-epimerase